MAKQLYRWTRALACGFFGFCLSAQAASDAKLARGESLYATHCSACHTEQMHWRDRGLVTDMNSLSAQVRRWQTVSRANWSDEDIDAVTQYLNDLYYHFPAGRSKSDASFQERRQP